MILDGLHRGILKRKSVVFSARQGLSCHVLARVSSENGTRNVSEGRIHSVNARVSGGPSRTHRLGFQLVDQLQRDIKAGVVLPKSGRNRRTFGDL